MTAQEARDISTNSKCDINTMIVCDYIRIEAEKGKRQFIWSAELRNRENMTYEEVKKVVWNLKELGYYIGTIPSYVYSDISIRW